jgi:hypothetical protein
MSLWAKLLRQSLRLLPAAIVAMVLFGARSAAAAVPMCAEDGRSLIAPPILMPSKGHVLEHDAPCPELVRLLLDAPERDNHPQPPVERVEDAPRGVLVQPPALPRPRGIRVAFAFDRPVVARGVRSGIDRPPR